MFKRKGVDMLRDKGSDILNDYFSEGWEYVDNICQSYSTANSGHVGWGSVLIILKRKMVNK